MKWSEVINDKTLQDLPYKIELNEWGHIVMSPASNRHGLIQSKIARLLNQQDALGETFPECSIETAKGVKVADVIWGSAHFFEQNGLETPYRVAPEICVEVLSPSNTMAEMEEKRDLYLAKGAREVWVCDEEGQLTFFDTCGKLAHSTLFPDFPTKVSLSLPSNGRGL
ncbi:MAG: Uma2 family endonuclease [Candidatus Latescibacterota bacterium]|jgi:Uma2 family endonuclease